MLDMITEKIEGNESLPEAGGNSLVSMVDEKKLLRVVKRLFTGSLKETFGELLQNSQRAGAKNVFVTTGADRMTIIDDGTGLTGKSAEEMFAPLMRIAESSYERESVADQDPMGVGLFSLFALEGVEEVVLTNRGVSLIVETNRLWNEDDYWQTWQTRVATIEQGLPMMAGDLAAGLKIDIKATSDLVNQITKNLSSTSFNYNIEISAHEYTSPVPGYAGMMDIYLNGLRLNNGCESAIEMDQTLIETEYQGNRLLIGVNGNSRSNLINWYGQLIKADYSRFRFYLEVRTGRPVNPMSPSRRGIIRDSSWLEFKGFIKSKFREFVLNIGAEQITPLVIETIYHTDSAWANEFCPFFTATKLEHDETSRSFEDWGADCAKKFVLSYDSNPLLLDESVNLVTPSGEAGALACESARYGGLTFVPVINQTTEQDAYEISSGNPERLNVQKVWWQPGKNLEAFFAESGQYALCPESVEQIPQTGWQPVKDAIVFAFNESENWNIESCEDLIVGVTDTIRAKLDFLTNAAWCLWSYENDDSDGDLMEADFRGSLEEVKAGLFPDCLPDEAFDLWKIQAYFALADGERIDRLEFLYQSPEKHARAIGVKLTTNLKRTISRQFLSTAEAGLKS